MLRPASLLLHLQASMQASATANAPPEQQHSSQVLAVRVTMKLPSQAKRVNSVVGRPWATLGRSSIN